MKLVMIRSESGGPWEFDHYVSPGLRWEDEATFTVVEPDGERWNVVTVESAREDYGVVVPARSAR